jgi:hypothetical protein
MTAVFRYPWRGQKMHAHRRRHTAMTAMEDAPRPCRQCRRVTTKEDDRRVGRLAPLADRLSQGILQAFK